MQLVACVSRVVVRSHPVVVITGPRGQHPALAKLDLVKGPQGAALAGGRRETQLVVADKITGSRRPLVTGTFVVGMLELSTPGQTMVGDCLVELQLGADVLLIEHVVIQRIFEHMAVTRVNQIFG